MKKCLSMPLPDLGKEAIEVSASWLPLPESLIHRQQLRRETPTGFPGTFTALTAKNNLKLWRMPRGQIKTLYTENADPLAFHRLLSVPQTFSAHSHLGGIAHLSAWTTPSRMSSTAMVSSLNSLSRHSEVTFSAKPSTGTLSTMPTALSIRGCLIHLSCFVCFPRRLCSLTHCIFYLIYVFIICLHR